MQTYVRFSIDVIWWKFRCIFFLFILLSMLFVLCVSVCLYIKLYFKNNIINCVYSNWNWNPSDQYAYTYANEFGNELFNDKLVNMFFFLYLSKQSRFIYIFIFTDCISWSFLYLFLSGHDCQTGSLLRREGNSMFLMCTVYISIHFNSKKKLN